MRPTRPEDLAQRAAESWLKLTDAGDGGASWEQAAKAFKGAVTKEQWTGAIAGVRPPLGKVVSRTVKSRQYTREAAGGARREVRDHAGPETVFENKAIGGRDHDADARSGRHLAGVRLLHR